MIGDEVMIGDDDVTLGVLDVFEDGEAGAAGSVWDDAPVKKFRRDAGKKEPNRELGTTDTETSFAGLYYYVYFGLSF